eukprot:TRINITY_DN15852_c0_g1_i1.p1 TRINITY_DN15852_c0_g1~~TRINITY_DN15852_c0_g1_i1.p1  ORF type:complete len:504 (+),score=102.09 TRINITY_DN15852_c0_g1_i1:32-1513(+)
MGDGGSRFSSTRMHRSLQGKDEGSRLSLMPGFVVNWFESAGNTAETQEDPPAVDASETRRSFRWKTTPEEPAGKKLPAVRLRPRPSMRIHSNDNAAEHSLPTSRPAEQVDSDANLKTTLFDTLLDGLAEVVGNDQNAQDEDTTNAGALASQEQDLKLQEYVHTQEEEIRGNELKAEAEYAKEEATRIVQNDSFMQHLAAMDNPEKFVEEDEPPGELDGLDASLGPQAITTYSRSVLASRLSLEGVVSDWAGFSSYAGADQVEDLQIKWAWREKPLEKAPERVVAPEGFRVCGVQTSDVQACPVLRPGSDASFTTLFYVDTAAFPKYELRPSSRAVEQWRNDELIWTGRVMIVPARNGDGASSDCPADLPETMAQGWIDPIRQAEEGDWEVDDIVFVIGTHCDLPPHKRDTMTFARNLMGYERASAALTRTPNIVGAENVRSASADTVRQALLDAATEKVEEQSAFLEGEVSQEELCKIRGPPKQWRSHWNALF